MSRLSTLVLMALLGASLALAQTSGGSTTGNSGKKDVKNEKKGNLRTDSAVKYQSGGGGAIPPIRLAHDGDGTHGAKKKSGDSTATTSPTK